MRRLVVVVWLGSAAACGGAVTETVAPTDASAISGAADFGPWTATVDAGHPLIGVAWSPADNRALTRAEAEQRLAAARFVLLGETHDHPDHHRLQGELIQGLIAAGMGPAVAYEMLDAERQADIDAFSGSVDAFAELVDWANSGWPEWSLYRPAFAPAIEAKLPIFAAQFTRSQAKRFSTEGLAMLDPATVSRYELDVPLPPELQGPLLDEMFTSHCEMVPREELGGMVEIQRVRDAIMADAMLRGAEARGQVVLVAGTGHTRDVAVPRLLQMTGAAPEKIASVGFTAVDPERLEASDYGDDHNILVFTPGLEREDPCAAFRKQPG
jgi:uncharacterized iron-regulated protein